MRKFWFTVVLSLFIIACAKTVYVPVERKREVVVSKRDTIVLAEIKKEVVRVVTPDTVAVAKTRLAEARAEVSKGRLTLDLRNRTDSLKVATKIIYTTVRDSIPYPVRVVEEKIVRSAAWYDIAIRWVGGISFLIIVFVAAYKIIKWRLGFR